MLCLGLETSCDDTGVALVRGGALVDSLLSSQADAHAIFGGVVPELASREHGRRLGPMLDALLERNNLLLRDLDLIAVTRGPGLLGSLLAGAAFAKGLALALEKPLIGVNHLHAHLLAAGLEQELVFPALGLVISGGHTEIYLLESPERFIRLGRALDDAVGEAFDKAGKAIGLPYPAGRQIDELATRGNPKTFAFPLAYVHNENLDFSFSGLKTAAVNCGVNLKPEQYPDFCASLNRAVAATLCRKAQRAFAAHPYARALYAAGGVAANSLVRARLQKLMDKSKKRLIMPSIPLCMDNAAMIAYAGSLLYDAGYEHGLELEAIPRGRKIPDDMRKRR